MGLMYFWKNSDFVNDSVNFFVFVVCSVGMCVVVFVVCFVVVASVFRNSGVVFLVIFVFVSGFSIVCDGLIVYVVIYVDVVNVMDIIL